MTRFTDWHEAHRYAQDKADRSGLDVAIRRVKEYGRDGFNVSYASVNDSDYARAEIVQPRPLITDRSDFADLDPDR